MLKPNFCLVFLWARYFMKFRILIYVWLTLEPGWFSHGSGLVHGNVGYV